MFLGPGPGDFCPGDVWAHTQGDLGQHPGDVQTHIQRGVQAQAGGEGWVYSNMQ